MRYRKLLLSRAAAAVVAGAFLTIVADLAEAALITEDFAYNNTAGGTGLPGYGYLCNPTADGAGWDGNWGATSGSGITGAYCTAPTDGSLSILDGNSTATFGPNLTYTGGGYNISQAGNGMAVTRQGVDGEWRGINRYVHTASGSAGGLAGDVWFSFLMETDSSHRYDCLQFNAHSDIPYDGDDYTRGSGASRMEVGIDGSQLRVTCGAGDVLGVDGLMASRQTHLILGKLTVGSGADTITVWADPTNLRNLGTGLTNSVDIGDSLYLVGLGSYRGGNTSDNIFAAYDALRISNNATAFGDVTGVVPEPGALVLVVTGGLGLCAYAWRKRQ